MITAVIINLLLFSTFFVIAIKKNNAGWADFAWGGAMVWTTALFWIQSDDPEILKTFIALWVMLWGGRLSLHLFNRMISEPEDGRYAWLRKRWNDKFKRNLYYFYLIQAVVITLLVYPVKIILSSNELLNPLYTILMLFVGMFCVIGESIADYQLKNFKSDPDNKGEVCNVGLWYYSRHPNYFFEWLMWLTLALIALPLNMGYLAFLSPIALGVFLFKGTGIPITERRAIESRGDKYRQYQATTPVFFPFKKRKINEE